MGLGNFGNPELDPAGPTRLHRGEVLPSFLHTVGLIRQSIERVLDVANIIGIVCCFASPDKLFFAFPELVRNGRRDVL